MSLHFFHDNMQTIIQLIEKCCQENEKNNRTRTEILIEKGEITKPQLRADRWNIILKKLGIDFDGTVLEEMFENGVAQGAYAVTGAYDLLDYLKDKYEMYIVSNGFRYVQESRLKIGDFNKYFNKPSQPSSISSYVTPKLPVYQGSAMDCPGLPA